jgi:hypothetical protein
MLCNQGGVIKRRFRITREALDKAKRARDFASGGLEYDRLQFEFLEAQRQRMEALTDWWQHLKSCKDCRGDLASE